MLWTIKCSQFSFKDVQHSIQIYNSKIHSATIKTQIANGVELCNLTLYKVKTLSYFFYIFISEDFPAFEFTAHEEEEVVRAGTFCNHLPFNCLSYYLLTDRSVIILTFDFACHNSPSWGWSTFLPLHHHQTWQPQRSRWTHVRGRGEVPIRTPPSQSHQGYRTAQSATQRCKMNWSCMQVVVQYSGAPFDIETYLRVNGDEVVTFAQSPDEGVAQPQTSKHDGKPSEELSWKAIGIGDFVSFMSHSIWHIEQGNPDSPM